MAATSERWIDGLQFSSLFRPPPQDPDQRKAQITAYVDYFAQFTSEQFPEDIAELVRNRYPSSEKRLIDDVLAMFVLHHPEHGDAVMLPIISCIIDGTIEYERSTPPFASFISLICPSTDNEYSEQWALACVEILRMLTHYNRPIFKVERLTGEADRSSSNSQASTSKATEGESSSPSVQHERKPLRPLSPWITDLLLAAPLGVRSDYFRWAYVLAATLMRLLMSDLRLLTLLEAGLPSWVLFFQSYPVFCHMYRPWMCPLARALYVAMSFVTVVIGFYDLYKNVPVLKVTASRLFGPLFDWIETWDMVSRIKYLGTMLFLHNAERAIMWFLMMTRTFRSVFSVLTQPLVAPFLVVVDVLFPFWNVFIQKGERIYSFICIILGTSWNLVDRVLDVLLLPVWYIASAICNFVTVFMSPIFLCLWGAICAPIRFVLGLSSFVGYIYKYMYDVVGGIWMFVSSVLKVASSAEAATKHTYEVSLWRALWNDLFSQIFRAIKSIQYGVAAFFAACNRHRLSIYNHLLEFIRRLSEPVLRSELLNANTRLLKSGSMSPPPAEPRERRPLPTKSTKLS